MRAAHHGDRSRHGSDAPGRIGASPSGEPAGHRPRPRLRSAGPHEVPALGRHAPRRTRPRTPAPLSPDDIARIRAPFRGARLLPGKAYHDDAIFDWEREEIFYRDWLGVARAEEPPSRAASWCRGAGRERPAGPRPGRRDPRLLQRLPATGARRSSRSRCGKAVRFQCPYHAWIYDLDGKLIRAKHTEDLDDFSFETLRPEPGPPRDLAGLRVLCFADESVDARSCRRTWSTGTSTTRASAATIRELRRAARLTYDVGANWKIVAENYSECYHCPGVHPLLNKLHALRPGRGLPGRGPVEGRLDALLRGLRDDVDERLAPRPAAHLRPRRDRRAPDLLLHPVAEPDRQRPPRLRPDPPGLAGRPQPDRSSTATSTSRTRQGWARSTSAAPSSSGTSRTAGLPRRRGCSSRGPDPGAGSPAATRTRRLASRRST